VTPDNFAKWLKLQGCHVIRTESTYWHSQGYRTYQAFPYHWTIQPREEELRKLLQENKAVGLRYSTPITAPVGQSSYHVVFEDSVYEIGNLSKWARKNVRRGLRNCSVEPISLERLAQEGWELQRDTLDRQGRNLKVSREDWECRCRAAVDLPGFEAWGALVKGRLGASVITFLMNDCCYMLYQQCHRDFLAVHLNNALSFIVTRTMVQRPSVRSIFYALHSLDAPASVDEFKFRMGYKAKPVRQRVVFQPWLAVLVNKASHTLVKGLLRLRPGNPTLSKCEGMMCFYLEGQRPICEQALPEPLRDLDFNNASSAGRVADAR